MPTCVRRKASWPRATIAARRTFSLLKGGCRKLKRKMNWLPAGWRVDQLDVGVGAQRAYCSNARLLHDVGLAVEQRIDLRLRVADASHSTRSTYTFLPPAMPEAASARGL